MVKNRREIKHSVRKAFNKIKEISLEEVTLAL